MHQSDIAKLLAALVVFLVVAFAVTGNGPWVLLGALVALAFAAWWFLEQRRRSSTSAPTRTSDNDSTSRTSRTERPVVVGRDGGAEKLTVERPTGSGSDKRTAPREVSGQDRLSPLRSQLPHIPNMSGAAFERYMANVFKALGYNARVLGGAGDQGVDLLLQKGSERIAVQCKNLRRPVGNPPVQQVLAGKLYHKTDRAWVVAPAGYTDGARTLARRTDVVLFDRRSIEKLIQQAEQRAEEQTPPKRRPVDVDAESTKQTLNTMAKGHMQKHTISVGNDRLGETVSFTAKLLGTASVNGGKEVNDRGAMDWSYYRLPDNTYRVLIDDGNTTLLLPSNFVEAMSRDEPVEYGRWTEEELLNEGEYGRVFKEHMKNHPEGAKRIVRDLD